jgi:signal transduction histidine kinase
MSYVTFTWALVTSGALLLALMHGIVWLRDRQARASLAFAIFCLGISGMAVTELGTMHARTPAEWGEWVRWCQVPLVLLDSGVMFFIRLHFGTGRLWLLWTALALRLGIMVSGFVVEPNFNFDRIDSIEKRSFLGEPVTVVGQAVPASSQWVATLTTVLLVVFVADACVQLWLSRAPDARRRVLVVGSTTFLSVALASFSSQLLILGGVRIPVLVSLPFLIMLAAMLFELSRDLLRASRLSRELSDSQARLDLAASAAGLGLWSWNGISRHVLVTDKVLAMVGQCAGAAFDVARIRAMIHPDDAERVLRRWRDAAAFGSEAEIQFRIRLPEGSVRWLLARGRAEIDSHGRLVSVQGVVRDDTDQQRALQENEELRREIAHAGRVTMLESLSTSLAHELRQPLSAILLNSQAAEMLLNRPRPELEELREILAEIVRDDRRAAEVIESMSKLLKRRELEFAQVSVDALVRDVAALLKADAAARSVALICGCEPELPPVRGDRVHLSQVLINLVVNAMDAVASQPPTRRQVTLHASALEDGRVQFMVSDTGTGVPEPLMTRIFEPFFTTKATGMGMGLSVSRTIAEAHGGELWAENSGNGGATFHLRLPALGATATLQGARLQDSVAQ